MKVASVIVDVPVLGTDRTFDYLIPSKWKGMIQPGMRVSVPFGPRAIQGFVVEVKDDSNVKKLRELIEPLDLTPVLNEELLQLGHWIARETLSFKISAFHAMLPTAMKAKYEKKIRRVSKETNLVLEKIFRDKEELSWQEAEKRNLLQTIHAEIRKGNVEVLYYVKNRARKKE